MRKIIYKYFNINKYLYDTIISSQLFFSSHKQFNDPYECRMIMNKLNEDEFITYYKGIGFKDEHLKMYIDAFRKEPAALSERIFGAYQKMLDYWGICCFSKVKDNVLLWSHYADSHKGVCLGFDYELMAKSIMHYEDVDYTNEPFYFDINEPQKSISKALITKSNDWSYEEEVRFVIERSKHTTFPLEALVEVNFGSRCEFRDILTFSKLIINLPYINCNLLQATVNEKKYQVEFGKVNLGEVIQKANEEMEVRRFELEVDLSDLLNR